jgi:hypothetical protein
MRDSIWFRVVLFSLIPITSYFIATILFPLYFLIVPVVEPFSFYDSDQYGGDTTFHTHRQGWLWMAAYSLLVGAIAAGLTGRRSLRVGIAATFGVAIVAAIITHIIMHFVEPTYRTTYP